MKQFEGLCNDNLVPPEDQPCLTTNDDLQGFWDMVMLQVNNVDDAFAEVEKTRENGWMVRIFYFEVKFPLTRNFLSNFLETSTAKSSNAEGSKTNKTATKSNASSPL